LQLNIWNAIQKESIDISSPAKDVDIYVGTSCIWSGTLEQENNLINDRSSKNNQLVQSGKCIDGNTLAVFVPNRAASSIISMGKMPVTNSMKIDQKGPSRQIDDYYHSNETSLNPKIHDDTESYDINTGADSSSAPSWLSELKPNTKVNEKDLDFHDTPRKARPLSGRRALPIGMYIFVIY
jgi:hypothetical protein